MNETNQSKTWDLKLHNGLSSILLILVILSLISFACLSMVSAVADQKLTDKMCIRTTNYYAADSDAKEKLKTINDTLLRYYNESEDSDAYFATVGTGSQFYIPVSDTQKLMIELEYLYPEVIADTSTESSAVSSDAIADSSAEDSDSDNSHATAPQLYKITEWRIVTDTSALEYDTTLQVAP